MNITTDTDYNWFIGKVLEKTGIDLCSYKEAQMKRRLTTLRAKYHCSDFQAFFQMLEKDTDLYREFLDKITINVTEFWRNKGRWEVLRDTILPRLAEKNAHLRIWSAACSTGEEPYTLAMILKEKGILSSTSLTATDLDTLVLQRAKEGIYSDKSFKEMPETYVKSFFTPQEESNYQVHQELREAIHFERHNLLLDAYFSNMDLIVCRNVLIYFTEEAKHHIYTKFSEALKPGGILFVGSTEQIFTPKQYGLKAIETFFYMKE